MGSGVTITSGFRAKGVAMAPSTDFKAPKKNLPNAIGVNTQYLISPSLSLEGSVTLSAE